MKKLLVAIASLLCMSSAAISALASIENPLAAEGISIRLLENFSGYEDLEQLYGTSVSDNVKEKVALDGQSLLFTLNGEWFDTRIPIKGFSEKSASDFEPGVLVGAEGIGLYIDTCEPLGITEFTPSIFALEGGVSLHYNMAPDSRYYLVSSDGVTYEGTSNDTGWGEGIIGAIGINFKGMLLVPFESLKYRERSFNPDGRLAQSLQLKGFSGDVRVKAVFIYGEGISDYNSEEIRDFFVSPDRVEIPRDYQITQRISEAFDLDNGADKGGSWLIPAAAAACALGAAAALFIRSRKNKKEDKLHEDGE